MVFNMKLRSCALTVLGSAILAFGLYNIHSFSGICEGGVLGLTLLLEYWLDVSPAISGLILNAICYIIGWRSLGNDFIGYSILATISFSLFYAICEMFPPLFPSIATTPLIASVCGAVFVGVGVGISVRAGGATCGDDALAMSLAHKLRIDIKYVYLISDLSVLFLSVSYLPLSKVLYSLLSVVLSGQIISLIQNFKIPAKTVQPDGSPEDWSARDVLVGTLRNHAQLEVCIKNNFYHIPAARLYPDEFPVRYVAIYQSNYKFGIDAGIRYFGEVEKCTLVPRYKIGEIPKNSDEMYYRFDIKEWRKLKTPILPREGDFVNLSTTLFLLENSREVPELLLRSESEHRLYTKIRERISGETFLHEFEHCGATLVFDRGRIIVKKHGEQLFICTFDEYIKRPSVTFRKIQNNISREN